jgi:predicted O-methyltransferase YrrM
MIINYQDVKSQNIDYFINDVQIDWPLRDGEHYRLLTYLANQHNGINIIDAGTYQGLSALALAQNPNNKIWSYDIEKKEIPFLSKYSNVELRVLDINKESADTIKSADIILLDVDPHDGIQEKVFTDLMNEIGYEGYVICDDIYINADMAFWWNTIDLPKYEVTPVGHMHGTGIICYNKTIEINDNILHTK